MRSARLLLSLGLGILVAVTSASATASSSAARPVKGSCTTTFTIGFDPVAGLPLVHILGACRLTHLGKTSYEAWQWLYPDGSIVNDGTYTAADGDELRSHVVGSALPSGPTILALEFSEWYTGGTGRFSHVAAAPLDGPPSTTGTGSIDLAASTGAFVSTGSIDY